MKDSIYESAVPVWNPEYIELAAKEKELYKREQEIVGDPWTMAVCMNVDPETGAFISVDSSGLYRLLDARNPSEAGSLLAGKIVKENEALDAKSDHAAEFAALVESDPALRGLLDEYGAARNERLVLEGMREALRESKKELYNSGAEINKLLEFIGAPGRVDEALDFSALEAYRSIAPTDIEALTAAAQTIAGIAGAFELISVDESRAQDISIDMRVIEDALASAMGALLSAAASDKPQGERSKGYQAVMQVLNGRPMARGLLSASAAHTGSFILKTSTL